jgi:hypothetical protein
MYVQWKVLMLCLFVEAAVSVAVCSIRQYTRCITHRIGLGRCVCFMSCIGARGTESISDCDIGPIHTYHTVPLRV